MITVEELGRRLGSKALGLTRIKMVGFTISMEGVGFTIRGEEVESTTRVEGVVSMTRAIGIGF